jgi:broad specificity phosphatase PhoE
VGDHTDRIRKGQMDRIYIARHGDYIHGGPHDGELSEWGKKQAEAIGATLADMWESYIIFSSPYKRCVMTANIIAKHIKPYEHLETKLLREFTGKDGEDYVQMAHRAMVAFQLATGFENYDVVLVTHRAIIQVIMGLILDEDPPVVKIEKGQVYEVSTKGEIRVRYEDRWGRVH